MKIFRNSKGFTLIELLIVIAILGILAAGVLVAIDPIEQINRGRDSGRKSSISQLGNAVQAYYVSQALLPTANATWQTTLVNSGEIKIVATNTQLTATACANNNQSGYCYLPNGTNNFIIYTRLDSKSDAAKGGTTCQAAANQTFFVYASTLGKAGIMCKAGEAVATDEPTVF